MPEEREHLPHLILRQAPKTEKFTSPQAGGGGFRRMQRSRRQHGRMLQKQLEEAQRIALGTAAEDAEGIVLEFKSEPGYDLALNSLEARRSGIQLLSSRVEAEVTVATVFVPLGKTEHFMRILQRYLAKESPRGVPRHSDLVDNIAAIRRAVLDSFWTDDENERPKRREPAWWEIWLRSPDNKLFARFHRAANAAGIEVPGETIEFSERRVVLAHATREQLASQPILLDTFAELRRPKETAAQFLRMPPQEQAEWAEDLRRRLRAPAADAPVVCILDTGVNRGHILLAPALPQAHLFSYQSSWGVADHDGHGTEMAGVALYGDLAPLLASSGPLTLEHGLESVKILPPQDSNPPNLYGSIMIDAVAQVELAQPTRHRVHSLAVTSKDNRDRGRPSSWSAAIDRLAAAAGEPNETARRLFCVAAGNTDGSSRTDYPNANLSDGVHDPGQAWNALTVGAYAWRDQITDPGFQGHAPLGEPGDLGPSTTTSLIWDRRRWPAKPDIVLDGGNQAISGDRALVSPLDELSLLTTYWQPLSKQFVATFETSAATAQAARIAAIVQAHYPKLWPETVRALIVDSARWMPAMLKRFPPDQGRLQADNLLRAFGWGVPDIDRALWSARNSLTLIAEGNLQPFDRDGGVYKTRDLNLHQLPWPQRTLEDLGATPVEMRVTLSYFVEPDPARRGEWKNKYRYASHGLRFEVKTATESVDGFRARINRQARDEEAGRTSSGASDSAEWVLGPTLRKVGSLHSDIWTGPAAALASKDFVAVYPVTGWWRERHHLGHWDKQARYALVISIRAPEVQTDLYTPIAIALKVPIAATT